MWKKKRYWKWAGFTLVTVFLYIFQTTLSPDVFSVPIDWMFPFAVMIGLREGPYAGAGFGILCGFLTDMLSSTSFGYSAFMTMVAGVAAGLLIINMRLSLPVASLLTAALSLIYYSVTWFFFYYFWNGEAVLFLRVVPLQILLAVLAGVPLYYLVRRLSNALAAAD